MGFLTKEVMLGISLVILSAVVYFMHYLIFHDSHHIFIYLIGDIGFVFIEVLLVTLIIHRVLEIRDRRNRLQKLNMVVGAFFTEVGTKLLALLSDYDPGGKRLKSQMIIEKDWGEKEFETLKKRTEEHDFKIDMNNVQWRELKNLLGSHREFMLRLMENPNLLEHESFTDLLQAIFHLAEELGARRNLENLPQSDYEHMAGDIKRVYKQLARQWVSYMEHLQEHYPYLFSLALRTNPFDEEASPVVGQ